MPLPASPCLFAASASPVPRSPSSAWFSLLFPRLRRLQLRLRRLLRWPWALAHVGAIFRLLALARTGAGCAHSARRGGGAGDPGFSRTAVLRGRRQWHPTPVPLPGKSHGRRSLEGCSSWGLEESDTTERFHFHFSLSCIGEGNGNPFQCSCLENPRDRRAWWAAVYPGSQSRTRLKRLSSSSSYAQKMCAEI